MKRYLLVTLTFLLLLFPGKAGATSLLDTQQFRALDNYVLALEGRKEAVASPEDKTTYREQLRLRRDVALERLGNLKEERLLRAQIQYKKSKQRILQSLQEKTRARKSEARREFSSDIRIAQSRHAKATREISKRYGQEIKSLEREIKTLRSKMRKTKDPAKRIDIGNSINSLQGALKPLKDKASRAQKKADWSLAEAKKSAARAYREQVADIEKDFARDWARGKKEALSLYLENKAGVNRTVESERYAVVQLFDQGVEIIASMPEAKKSKKSRR